MPPKKNCRIFTYQKWALWGSFSSPALLSCTCMRMMNTATIRRWAKIQTFSQSVSTRSRVMASKTNPVMRETEEDRPLEAAVEIRIGVIKNMPSV
ncbi:MAG: hypothetical protein WDN09_01630 [bacterium]